MYTLIKFQLMFGKSYSTLLIFLLVGPFKNFIPPLDKRRGYKFSGNMVTILLVIYFLDYKKKFLSVISNEIKPKNGEFYK